MKKVRNLTSHQRRIADLTRELAQLRAELARTKAIADTREPSVRELAEAKLIAGEAVKWRELQNEEIRTALGDRLWPVGVSIGAALLSLKESHDAVMQKVVELTVRNHLLQEDIVRCTGGIARAELGLPQTAIWRA
jgi:uncharacterized small protein (DUF1192 family)